MSSDTVNAFRGPVGIRVADCSSLAAVEYEDKLHVFHVDRGSNSIWGAVAETETEQAGHKLTLSPPYNIAARGAAGIRVAPRTSPAAVVFQRRIFVFYNGTKHENEASKTYYSSTRDGVVWRIPMKAHEMNLRGFVSPSATVYRGKLCVFWTSSDETIYWAAFNGKSWTNPATAMSGRQEVSPQCNPCATTFNGNLYLFYNKLSHRLPVYNTLIEGTWHGPRHVLWKGCTRQLGQDSTYTVRSAMVLAKDQVLRLVLMSWDEDAFHVVDYRKSTAFATPFQNLGQGPRLNSEMMRRDPNLIGVRFHGVPCLLWTECKETDEDTLCLDTGLTYEVDSRTFAIPAQWLRDGKNFTVTLNESKAAELFSDTFADEKRGVTGTRYIDYNRHDATVASRVIKKVYGNLACVSDRITEMVTVTMALLSSALASEEYSIAIEVYERRAVFRFLHQEQELVLEEMGQPVPRLPRHFTFVV